MYEDNHFFSNYEGVISVFKRLIQGFNQIGYFIEIQVYKDS